MSRPSKSRYAESLASAVAEDRAVVFLGKFPWPIAHAIALRVELSLALKWKREQDEMLRRRDPRKVFQIFAEDFQKLHRALAEIPPAGWSTGAEEENILDLFAALPSDRAWWTARRVVTWIAFKVQQTASAP
jgi:hypothetical protein